MSSVGRRPPSDVASGAATALGERKGADALVSAEPLTGGCIHPAARIRTGSGRSAFLKWSERPGPSGFRVEAEGLRALKARGGLRVPQVLGVGTGSIDRRGWLLLELVEEGPPDPSTPERLGAGLARLHRPLEDGAAGRAAPGWEEDGWIGPLPQANRLTASSWPEFWREARLLPQWERAEKRFDRATRRRWERLLARTPEALEGWESDGLSLLHGDLWSGNVLTDREAEPVLIDPAVYRGHREVDLAMMELFGGFDPAVLERYRAEFPVAPAYAEVRRDLYQLYPLLVHVNLFGGGYVDGVRAKVDRLAVLID